MSRQSAAHLPDIVVTGMQRSGTTYTGHILSLADLFEIQEPFNYTLGSVLVDQWKPYYKTIAASGRTYESILHEVFTGRIRFKSRLQTRNPFYRLMGRLTGITRNMIRYNTGYMLSKLLYRRRLFKDPDMIFCAEHIQRSYGYDVVIMVRHPCAVYSSIKRLNWGFSPSEVSKQPALVKDHLHSYSKYLEERQWSLPEAVAILWLFIYGTVDAFRKANDKLIVVRQEDIALNPRETFSGLFDRLKLPLTGKVRTKIAETTGGTRVKAKDNRPHDFTRDSRRLANAWRESLSAGEIETIRRIVEPVYAGFYPEGF